MVGFLFPVRQDLQLVEVVDSINTEAYFWSRPTLVTSAKCMRCLHEAKIKQLLGGTKAKKRKLELYFQLRSNVYFDMRDAMGIFWFFSTLGKVLLSVNNHSFCSNASRCQSKVRQ